MDTIDLNLSMLVVLKTLAYGGSLPAKITWGNVVHTEDIITLEFPSCYADILPRPASFLAEM